MAMANLGNFGAFNMLWGELIARQSIGLVDKFGREICVGDIIQVVGEGEIDYYPNDVCVKLSESFVVRLDSRYLRVRFPSLRCYVYGGEVYPAKEINGIEFLGDGQFELEIVGNIYANPLGLRFWNE